MNLGNYETNRLYLGNDFKHKYILRDEDINLADKNSSHSIILNLIADNSVLLDVGCSYGYLGKWLKINKNCVVYGIDNNADALNYARQNGYYEDLFLIDLDNPNDKELERFNQFGEIFDYILLADVLEHLKYPENPLLLLSKKLKFYSSFIVSVPNIANIDIIFNLIEGRFNYGELGVLDNTHLIFFTKKSFAEWIKSINEYLKNINKECRFDINFIGSTIYQSENVKEIISKKPIVYNLLKLSNPDIDAFQNIFALTKVQKDDEVLGFSAFDKDLNAIKNISQTLQVLVDSNKKSLEEIGNLQKSLKEKEKIKVLFLSIAHQIGHGVPVVIARHADYFVKKGYTVYIGGPKDYNEFSYPGCKRIYLNNYLDAALFANKNDINCVIAHTPPFFPLLNIYLYL